MKNTFFILMTIVLLGCQEKKLPSTVSVKEEITTQKKERNIKPDGTPYSDEELQNMGHAESMAVIYEAPTDTLETIGILVYDGFFTLDALGPLSVLNSMYPTKKLLIGREKGTITSNDNVKIEVDYGIQDIEQLDMLIIPGGFIQTYQATKDQELLDWIRKIDQNSKYTVSVCTGAWILGAAGLLKGKKATTHWYRANEKLAEYGATFVKERYINDGKYWTSAGVSAGIDMSLALMDKILGRNYAEFVTLNLEYDPKPPFEGGHPDKTDRVVTIMTEKMFDEGLAPYIEK
ncbi:DJ-1/PfpI family protein [Flagellimonas sp. HMM57]|uniref:DJ-1/PfpI family protein n=1 Tax=unclassified Flagellimonas TaxID=2644544 RepID=UPI0013D07953|nr:MULTISPECIES: DJ-1/PfpI family protein [unclassified Flagellimonas]UII74500.1 DJ-1/PfpI family protein [Flagellimonas sp. HMM57]